MKSSVNKNSASKNGYSKGKDDLFLEMSAQVNAINSIFAFISFDLKGNIISANDTFLDIFGYTSEEIEDKSHKLFVDPDFAKSPDHKKFWKDLAAGIPQTGEFKRLSKNNKTIWLQATYTPVRDHHGDIVKVIKYATDITKQKTNEEDAQAMNENLRATEEELRQNLEEMTSIQEQLKKREEDASKLTKKYEEILNGCVDAVVIINERGIIEYANKTTINMFGYEAEEMIGQNVKMLTGSEHKSNHDQYLKNYLTTGEKKVLGKGREVEAITKEGKRIPIFLSLSEAETDNGKVFAGFIKDLSELKAKEFYYEQILNAIPLPIFVTDNSMKWTFLNKAVGKSFDISDSNLKNMLGNDCCNIDVEICNTEECAIAKLKSGNSKTQFNHKGRHYKVDSAHLYNMNGEKNGFIEVIQDFTDYQKTLIETKDAAEELRAQEEELRQSMEELEATQEEMQRKQIDLNGQMNAINSTSAFIEFDNDGIVQTANEIFLNVMGYSLDEIQGKHHKIFCDKDYVLTDDYITFWKELKKGIPQSGEFKRISKGNKDVWLVANYTPVTDKEGNVLKIIKLANDITKAKLAQIDTDSKMNAIDKTTASIEFNLDGSVVTANDIFLDLMGYTVKEIQGEHHKIFCETKYAQSEEYKDFWEALRKGEFQNGEFKRKTKSGDYVWIQGTYNPIFDLDGNVTSVVKFANDITERKRLELEAHAAAENLRAQEEELRQNLEEMKTTQEEMERRQVEMDGQMRAINSTSAFVEFSLDGKITRANDIFLQTMRYELNEIEGKHHQLFCDPDYARTREYENFWNDLRRGIPQSGEYKRVNKHGEDVWLLANYTPVMDNAGNPVKIIKLATDITETKINNANYEGQLTAVNKSYAVIEFDLKGNVLTANQNFLDAVGYSMNEIKGAHHRLFCESEYVASNAYRVFWEDLNAGKFHADTYKRIGKNGREVYIQATYNPIFDIDGKPYKVVKYATNITDFTVALNAVSKFVSELKQGNFDAELDIQAKGNIGQMIKDNLSLKLTLKEIIGEINNVVKQAGEEGNLNARLNIDNANGAWKGLVDSLNTLLQSIAEPMLEFNSIITEMAKGDLTHSFKMHANGDIKNMANSLNTAISNLNVLLGNIGSNADIVSESTEQMLKKSEDINRSTAEVSSAITQMAQGAQDQASQTDASSRLVNQVKLSADEMEHKAGIINKTAEEGKKNSETGLKTMKDLVENMDNISSSANLTSESIGVLTERAEEIGRTLNVITDIAAQTNLLALNAAIEAARAGDAGRGFAVVADEIRKLAENSRKSAVEIEKIISDVQKDTQAATKAIETMGLSVGNGNKATKEAEGIFLEISKSSEDTFVFSEEIKKASAQQKESIESVVSNIEQIVVVAEQTAAGSQQVAGSAQKLNINMSDISSSSNRLSEIANELKAGVKRFKLA